MAPEHIDHDGLFKQLLDAFFVEFMEVFFPRASEWIDFNHLKPLPTEVIGDLPTGEHHVVDLVLETRLKESDTLLLLHIEPQSYVQADFNERMYVYASHLFQKYRRPVVPIAIFSYDRVREEPDTYRWTFPFVTTLQFRFLKLELKRLHWRDYLKSDNPAAAALLSKMHFRPEERVQVKLEFLRTLTRMELDPARTELLGGFFESYLRLNAKEEIQLDKALKHMGAKGETTMEQLTTSWHKKGRAEGKVEATRIAIREYMQARFDVSTSNVVDRLDEIADLERLQALQRAVFRANSPEEALARIEGAEATK